jgi:hypothetical protein
MSSRKRGQFVVDRFRGDRQPIESWPDGLMTGETLGLAVVSISATPPVSYAASQRPTVFRLTPGRRSTWRRVRACRVRERVCQRPGFMLKGAVI